jgi:hypothetical protein
VAEKALGSLSSQPARLWEGMKDVFFPFSHVG